MSELQNQLNSVLNLHINDQLSKKRAKAVVDYLVLKGVPRKLVKSKGFVTLK